MRVSPTDAELIRRSFAQLTDRDVDAAAALFYERLFELKPDLRRLFPPDLRAQGRKFIGMLAVAVAHADRLEVFTAELMALGRRHHRVYGAVYHDYSVVERALVDMLLETLRARFTRAAEDAWRRMYRHIALAMQAGADIDI